MEASEGFEAFTRNVNPALSRFLRVAGRDYQFVEANDCQLRTRDGATFTDWVSGFGALSFGHHPAFAENALREALDSRAPHLYSEALNPFAGRLATALLRAAGAPYETCFFANGGAEAVEAAIKTAALATDRAKILYLSGGYHGTTLGALGCMARGLYRDPFERLIAPIFDSVELEDIASLDQRLSSKEYAAFLLEPIQMEAGARIVSDAYLEAARRSCTDHGTLLVFDEIQTGVGRTGEAFAFQHGNVRPDAFTLGKALGAGLVPISAAVFGSGLWEAAYGTPLRSEIHNSTLGGSALACQVALAVLEELESPTLLAGVRARSLELQRLLAGVCERHHSVARLSLRGLLGGIQLKDATHPWASWAGLGLPELEARSSSGALAVQRLAAKHGILAHLCGHDWSVVRVEPPLTIGATACRAFADALDETLTWLEHNAID